MWAGPRRSGWRRFHATNSRRCAASSSRAFRSRGRPACAGPASPARTCTTGMPIHPDLAIAEQDYLLVGPVYGSAGTQRLHALCRQRRLTHLLYLGIATNNCVVSKAAGMLYLARAGLEVILARDLTPRTTGTTRTPATPTMPPRRKRWPPWRNSSAPRWTWAPSWPEPDVGRPGRRWMPYTSCRGGTSISPTCSRTGSWPR